MSARVSSSTRAATSKIISPTRARSRRRNSSRSATRFHGSATTAGLRSRSPSRATSWRRTPHTAYTVRAMLCSCDSITSASGARSPREGPKASSRLSTASRSSGGGNTSLATAISRFTLSTVWPITGATSSQTASEWVPSSASTSKRTRSTSASWRVASLAAWNSFPTRGRRPSSKRSATTLSRRVMGSVSFSSAEDLCGTLTIPLPLVAHAGVVNAYPAGGGFPTMEQRKLGRCGLRVSSLSLGAMTFGDAKVFMKDATSDESEARRVLDAALEAGMDTIDTANGYAEGLSEMLLGQWLKGRRQQVTLCTKVRFPTPGTTAPMHPNDQGLSRKSILWNCEQSLRRLQTDYIDLYQAHMQDRSVPIEETVAAFDQLVREGKVRYVGCSNHAGYRVGEALWAADRMGTARYESMQIPWRLVSRDPERQLVPAPRPL